MLNLSHYSKLLFTLLFISFLCSCSSRPVAFDAAAKKLANRLLREVQIKSLLSPGVKKIVMDDFTDEDTGEVVASGEAIEKIIFAEAEKTFDSFSLSKMNSTNIRYADYLVSGVISLEQYKRKRDNKYYHIFASATDLKTGKVIASASA